MAIEPIKSTEETRASQLAGVSTDSTVPATKMFAVNATGNLFVASTLNGGEGSTVELTDAARKAFSQVSVFFAAMTKAIASTTDPATGEPYSLYDYEAINSVIRESGMFIQIGENDYSFESKSWGVELSKELIQVMMAGFTGNMAAVGKALSPLVSSVGSEGLKISSNSQKENSSVGALVFVCEYLLGAVSITPILVVSDMKQNEKVFQAGPCFKAQKKTLTYTLKKLQYLFVPPEFMQEAVVINEAMNNPEFDKLVTRLMASLDEEEETGPSAAKKATETKDTKK